MPAFGPDRLSDGDLDDRPSLPANAARIRSGSSAIGGLCAHTTSPSASGSRCSSASARWRSTRRPAGASAAARHVAGDSRRPAGRRLALADLRRRLHQPAAQPAHADHARERQPARPAVDVPDRHARQFRNHLAPARQRPVRDGTAERRVGARRADRAARSGATAASCRPEPDRLLRPRQPRVRRARRQALHDTLDAHLLALDMKNRRHRLGRDPGGLQERLRLDDCAARRQGQGHRRRRRRRVRHPRLHRCVRRADRQARVALLHDSRAGRAGPRDVGGRLVEDRRRGRLGHRRVRSRAEPRLLRHRQPGPGLPQREPQGRQPLQRLRSSRSTPTPASSAGTTSSRRTTCTTGTRPRCRFWPTSRSTDSRARS